MNKVKCCHNCKYCHMAKSYPMFCIVNNKNVEPDDRCDNHIPKDIMTEYVGEEQ